MKLLVNIYERFSNDWFDVEDICMFTVEAAVDISTFTNF